jgi:hypothetical protein
MKLDVMLKALGTQVINETFGERNATVPRKPLLGVGKPWLNRKGKPMRQHRSQRVAWKTQTPTI